jgi:beta-glucosidase
MKEGHEEIHRMLCDVPPENNHTYSRRFVSMRSAKIIYTVAAALMACTTVFGQSGDFQTKGQVMSGNQPVAMATVTYTNVAMRLSWDFSLSDGTFGGATVSAKNPLPQDATVSLPSEGVVTIDIYGMNGELAGTVNGKLDKGTYTLRPLAAKLAQSMYLLRIRAGNTVTYQKMLNAGFNNAGYTISLSSKKEPLVMAKKLAAIDSIRVGKTGYTPVVVPIAAYTDNVGIVTLTPVDIEGEVNTEFAKLTQLQKYGQLCMPPFTSVGTAATASNFCGSIFGGGGCFNGGNSPSSCADLFDGYQTAAMGNSLKIPLLMSYDAVHGASAVPQVTFFPHNLAMGAIQDTLLLQKAFRVCALEVRGSGANWGFGPCIAVIRDDRWGRSYEGFCETPERTQIMARHAVLGCQLTDMSNPMSYLATCKHFAGDGNTVNGVNQGETVGPDATARAINLPGYASAVAAGVGCIMPSFSSWCDGTPMHQNKTLITGWLKSTAAGNPGFQGFVVGDWEAGWPLPTCMDAGLDVPMAPGTNIGIIATNDPTNNNNFTKLDALGGTYPARIDDAVKRVLRVKYWMNLFDPKNYMTDRRLTALVGCAAHRDVARACVRAECVLLKNAGPVIPIPKTANVAILGQAGNDVGIQCGGWTVSWQGQQGAIPGGGGTTILQGVQSLCTGTVTTSGTSDYTIVVLSENPYAETSFPNVAITGNDATGTNATVITQAAAAHAAGKKVIGILIAGRALDISGILPSCDAFIWACLPGSEGGLGIAQLLFKDQGYAFSGKLQVTWPNNSTNEPINAGDGQTGLFAYGYGLTD